MFIQIEQVGLGLSKSTSAGPTAQSIQYPSGAYPLQKLNINVSRHVIVDRNIEQSQNVNERKGGDFTIEETESWKKQRSPVTM